MRDIKHYVIIGNSAAAVGAVEGIRKLDKDGHIVIISDEPYHTYSRPLISYWLGGKVTDEHVLYREPDFYEKNNVTFLPDRTVTKIAAGEITLSEAGKAEQFNLPFDKLLIATGSRPFVPPTDGLDSVTRRYTFMKWDSAKAIKAEIEGGARKFLIVGAGLIGLKAAEALIDSGTPDLSVTVVDMANKVMSSVLDDSASDFVKSHIENNGVVFKLGTVAERFEPNKAYLKNGETVDFDVLIMAVGVRPNTELAKDAGIAVGRGIKTDQFQQTNHKNIYAAGDCTESYDISSGSEKVLAILPLAYMQGEAAGINMAGGTFPYKDALPMNAIGFFGLHIISAGDSLAADTASRDDIFVHHELDDDENVIGYKKLIFRDGLLIGYILAGDVSRAGIYTSLIRDRVHVGKLDFNLLKSSPQLMMFGREYRDEKLGGIMP